MDPKLFEKKFVKFIENDRLFLSSSRILLAVSGGVDSMVLCNLFSSIENEIGIAHINHQTRGKYSDDEAMFVESYAQKKKIPFFSIRRDLKSEAIDLKENFQSYARTFRYEWLDSIMKKNNFDYIATAHHKDDAIETAFFHFARGTGLGGLTGIGSKRDQIVRPLLFAHRNEIMAYAKASNIEWRDDQSNQLTQYNRNKIRLDILPQFEELNPNFRANAFRTIKNLSSSSKLLDYFVEQVIAELVTRNEETIIIQFEKILTHPNAAYLLYEIIKLYGFNADQCEQIIQHKQAGKIVYSQTHQLLTDRKEWYIRPKEFLTIDSITIPGEGLYSLGKLGSIKIERVKSFMFSESKNIEYIDFNKLIFPLHIRNWKSGDWFRPLGLQGKQKVQDFLTNLKLNRFEKASALILESDNKICWVIGHRLDERVKIEKHSSQCWRLEYLPIMDE